MKGETIARAWAVTRRDALTLGFTDHDAPLKFEGVEFRPESGLSASAIVQASGLSVDNSEVAGALSDSAITEPDLLAGRWDDAEVRLWEVDWSEPDRRALIFRGRLGEISRSGAAFRAELRGLSEPLNRSQGRVFHRRCSADLGDARCRVDRDAPGYWAEGTITKQRDAQSLEIEGIAGQDHRWFERGELVVMSGLAEGLRGMVKTDVALPGSMRSVELWSGLGLEPQPGDRVLLIAGCDKRAETCRLKFLNFANFRGFPHLPPEDWLIAPQVGR